MMLELSFIIFKCLLQLAENRLCGMCCLRAEHELRLIRLTMRGICHAFHVWGKCTASDTIIKHDE
jgi:hypothetical protein